MQTKRRQLDIFTDLPLGVRRKLLRDAQFEICKTKTGSVKGAAIKAVLIAIDDREGDRECFASQSTLAIDTNLSKAQVKRAVEALTDMDLITTDRRNRQTNRHRVVWSSLQQHVRKHPRPDSRGHHDLSSDATRGHHDPRVRSPRPHGEVTMTSLRGHHDLVTTPLNSQLNTPPTCDIASDREWVVVVEDLKSFGLVTASAACTAARLRGWSPDYVREIYLDIADSEIPPSMQAGRLANVLTGKCDPPFAPELISQRQSDRLAKQAAADRFAEAESAKRADAIRNAARRAARGRGVPEPVIVAAYSKRLVAAGLERFLTENERSSSQQVGQCPSESVVTA